MNEILYGLTITLLLVSLFKDRNKTKKSLKKAFRSFYNILPQFLSIILLVGIILAFVDEKFISTIIGDESGFLGVIVSIVIGSITLIPGFISFPLAQVLLDNGAGYMQIAGFISSLMMVGVLTMPAEVKFFGYKSTFLRNGFAFLFAFVVAFIFGKVMS